MRFLALVAALVTACAATGGIDDGTSLSYGLTNHGALVHGVSLPVHGDGYLIPPTWANRKLNWATEEMVELIVRAGRRLERDAIGAPLFVADMSPRYGGPSEWHRSHQTGRDADLLFFAVDERGRPAPAPDTMIKYDATGAAAGRRFDARRNWALVRALLEDPEVKVQFLFIANPLRQMLLDEASAEGAPNDLVERAGAVMVQPGDSAPHDDHLHVRIFCPPNDRSLGCRDRGPLRWNKKGYKYELTRSTAM